MSATAAPPDLRRSASKAIAATFAAATLWVLLAAANPTTTYHLAAVIVAATAPVWARLDRGEQLGRREATALTAFSMVLAAAAGTALAAAGRLDGPALVGGSGFGETAIGVAAGGVTGWTLAVIGRPGRA